MTRKPGRSRSVAIACLLLATASGCASVKAREPKLRNALNDRADRRQSAHPPGAPCADLLDREGLLDLAGHDPATAASILERRLADRPEADGALTLAELSYRAGLDRHGNNPSEAMAWYRDAAALAALALREPGGTRPELAIQIHNHAVARLIRSSQAEAKRAKAYWTQILGDRGVKLASSTPDLAPARFADLLPAEDVRLTGMNHIYRNEGLGVPLIAHRRVEPTASPDSLDHFHPRELRSAATAVVVPSGGLAGGDWRRNPATLSLFDPFLDRTIRLGDRELSLAGDRTTPLAVQVAEGSLPTLEMTGLFDSDFRRPGVEAGLYMLRPYEPGKIPVVLVHGLFSSPRAFLQTINELGNDPELSARYQFWVFLYPTGQPIPASALQLRASLFRVRDALDPNRTDPSMGRMVLVGHSMGGLLSKMMVQDSGLALWDAAFRRPVAELKATPTTRRILDESLIYRPLPFVTRVIFIATPHRGSPLADQFFGRTIASLIRRSTETSEIADELVRLNGPDLITPELSRAPLNAIGNLRTDSPILRALDLAPIDPRVPYHSIIPKLAGLLPTDGIVEYRSSHLAGATSEKIVPGSHSSQQHPDVTQELRRILKLHLIAGP